MAPLEIQLLGQPAVRRGIESLALPASRKVRALLGFMALSPHPVMRSHLCDLLWDGPNDPRGELRWCLSRMRRLVDEPGVSRIETAGDFIALNLSGCFVDALAINQAAKDGFETRGDEELRTIAELFVGDLLAGLEFDRNPSFESWLVAQRRRFREIHVSLLDHLTRLLPAADARLYVDRWIQIAPYDLRPHELLLNELSAEGKICEGGEHLKQRQNSSGRRL